MTMPQELAPLALWAFPLLLGGGGTLLWHSISAKLEKQNQILSELVAHKVQCMREFSTKQEFDELDAQVQGLSRTVAKLEAVAPYPYSPRKG